MKVLIDTHTFLWIITANPKLSEIAKRTVLEPSTEVFLSAASGWEIATKYASGRLSLPDTPERYIPAQMEKNGFQELPITLQHALRVCTLPWHHRDPFDRILVAQCIVEGLSIITADPLITRYSVKTIW